MGSIIQHRLKSFIKDKRVTFLGVGPMSLNCINATIDLANDYDVPIFLIASRRQIDSEEFGCGYVNNWSTQEYSKYVIDNDKKGKIVAKITRGLNILFNFFISSLLFLGGYNKKNRIIQ